MKMTKEQEFFAYLKEIALLNEANGLLEWDSQTGMPQAGAANRAEVSSYISGLAFEKKVNQTMADFLAYFEKNEAELSELGTEVVKKVKEEYELNHNIPTERFQKLMKATSQAHSDWLKARENNQFSDFQPILEEIVALLKEFIPLWKKDEKTPYDVLLNQYEPEMTTEILDQVFGQVRDGIIELRKTIAEKGTKPRTDFVHRHVSKEQQRSFVTQVVTQLGYDFDRGRLDDTVHPFMLDLNRNDARITTRWNEEDVAMATFGVIHEAGHGMYEQNIAEKYDYTPLGGGTSMGIHESQSLFNEIIIGSSKAFWKKQYPLLQKITAGTFADIDFETFYKGLKETKASLIRIEADSLTYPIHIIIRYEIEKMLFNGTIEVKDLPQIWNDKYEEYLGIRPENDLEGVLQDVHWSGGSFGYFPSYALGYMYAAQLRHAMNQDIDIEKIVASNDYSPIRKWLTKNIHQYGASRKPNQLIKDATGEALNPQYLLDYMKKIYFDVYNISE